MKRIEFGVEESSENKLNGLIIGYCAFSGVRNEALNPVVDAALAKATQEVCGRFGSVADIANDPIIKGIRMAFSSAGIDPTKERPSGEALIRRIVGRQGLYRINAVVDTNNVISILSGCPCGVYNLANIAGSAVTFKVGRAGESYEGISGKTVSAENRIATADEKGVFGGPVADSKRTCVTANSGEVLMLVYFPENISEIFVKKTMNEASVQMVLATSGRMEYEGLFKIKK